MKIVNLVLLLNTAVSQDSKLSNMKIQQFHATKINFYMPFSNVLIVSPLTTENSILFWTDGAEGRDPQCWVAEGTSRG